MFSVDFTGNSKMKDSHENFYQCASNASLKKIVDQNQILKNT
jgi:hypothetical protein